MNNEIEVRIQNINKEELINKLKNLNAKFIGNWLQKRYVYDFHPVTENKWIRLRTNGIETTLTIKDYQDTKVGDTKELEIVVNDFDKTDLVLNELGYEKRSIQENKRIRYILNDVEIDIDTWPKLDTCVEFEGPSEEKLKEVIELLGYAYNEATTMDAQDIYLSKGYTKEDLNDLKFEGDE